MATLSKNADLNKTKAVKHLWKTGRRAASLPRQAAAKTQFPLRSAPTPRGVDPLPSKVGANYDTEWARRPGARLTRRVFLNTVWEPVITYYAEPTVRNADRLKALGGSGAIFASNHHSHADTIVMMTALPKPWRNRLFIGGAADYFFTSRPTSVLSALFIGAVPISRTGISRRTIEQPIKLLKKDWSMVIYPEGGRSQDGWAQDFKAGVAFLSKQSGAPVVPVHIDGTGSVMPKGQNWPTRAKVSVSFGQPMHMLEGETNQQFTDRIEAAIALLADENETDWWTARLRQAQGQTPRLQGPEVSPWRRKWATKNRRRVHTPSLRRKRWPFV